MTNQFIAAVQMFELAVIPYRTIKFADRYGFTVRDLMMLKAMETENHIASVDWFERPALFIEKYGRQKNTITFPSKVTIHSTTSYNLTGAVFHGRMWPADSLKLHETKICNWADSGTGIKVLLDYHPFYIPDENLFLENKVLYWYDLIDDFTKHNVFSESQRAAVHRKYEFVRHHAKLITGVSDGAVQSFSRGHTLPNKLLPLSDSYKEKKPREVQDPAYDLGFTGFITDKFDIPFVRCVAGLGFKVLIRGRVYHKHIARELSEIDGVTVGPEFHVSEQAAIFRQFSVGIIPYIPERCHDESPIKLVQYLSSGRPALLSKSFGSLEHEFSSWVAIYKDLDDTSLVEAIRRLIALSDDEGLMDRVRGSSNLFWDGQIKKCLEKLIELV